MFIFCLIQFPLFFILSVLQLFGFTGSLVGLYLYHQYKRDPAQMNVYCTTTALCTECYGVVTAPRSPVHNKQSMQSAHLSDTKAMEREQEMASLLADEDSAL